MSDINNINTEHEEEIIDELDCIHCGVSFLKREEEFYDIYDNYCEECLEQNGIDECRECESRYDKDELEYDSLSGYCFCKNCIEEYKPNEEEKDYDLSDSFYERI